jgi:rubrerythrin
MASASQLRKRHPKDQAIFEGLYDAEELQAIADAHDETAFPKVDMDIETQYCCPSCGYSWSGNPKPGTAKKEGQTT